MTISAQDVPDLGYGLDGRPLVKIRCVSGSLTSELVEDVAYLRSFWGELGRLIERLEKEY